jgi:hypothetical protein
MQAQQAGLLRALESRQAADEGATTKPAGKSTRKGE